LTNEKKSKRAATYMTFTLTNHELRKVAGEVAAATGADADSVERALTIALFPYQDYGGKVTYGQSAEAKKDFKL
jgi:hypothetical protein